MSARRLLVLLALACPACTPATRTAEWAAVSERTPATLAALDARDPSLAADAQGRVVLTWVAPGDSGADLWIACSRDSGEHFSPAQRLDERPGRVASDAESRPVVALGPAGQVVVAWASERDSDRTASDIVARASGDGGGHFGPTAILNRDHADPRSGYHGFAALATTPDGVAAVAWLDGRRAAAAGERGEPAHGEVWAALSRDGGQHWADDVRVAGDVCACCRLALAGDGAGRLALAYRGAANDLRDPRLALIDQRTGAVLRDTLLSADRWRLSGCPSIGPALTFESASGGHVSWYTGSDSISDGSPPGVFVMRWRGDGALGEKRLLADSVRAPSHPLLANMAGGTLAGVLAWPRTDSTRRVLAVRTLATDGTLSPWLFLGAGVRSAALAGDGGSGAWAAWVEGDGARHRLRLARITKR